MQDAGLQDVPLSPDVEVLRETFFLRDMPFEVLMDDGTVIEDVVFWEEPGLGETFREHGFVR